MKKKLFITCLLCISFFSATYSQLTFNDLVAFRKMIPQGAMWNSPPFQNLVDTLYKRGYIATEDSINTIKVTLDKSRVIKAMIFSNVVDTAFYETFGFQVFSDTSLAASNSWLLVMWASTANFQTYQGWRNQLDRHPEYIKSKSPNSLNTSMLQYEAQHWTAAIPFRKLIISYGTLNNSNTQVSTSVYNNTSASHTKLVGKLLYTLSVSVRN